MSTNKKFTSLFAEAAFLGVVLFPLAFWTAAAGAGEEEPDHGWFAAFRYPGLVLDPSDNISVDLIVKSTGKSPETILLEVTEKPAGWKTRLKGYGNTITGVFVAPGEERTITFTAEPEDKSEKVLPAGTFHFAVQAKQQGSAPRTTSLDVTVLEKEKAEDRVSVTTSYPVLRGPTGTKFEFTLDVENESDEEAIFSFKATVPEGWESSIKPSYEEKQISSLKIDANSSKSIELKVEPAYDAKAGEFPISLQVESPKARADMKLSVVLTGTFKIEAVTENDLLSLSARIGKDAQKSIYVRNTGSAAQEEITFMSLKPENWEVKFDPEKIQGLGPGEMKQVEVTITPAEEALVGDYSVVLRVEGERVTDDVELRVTVKAATLWGWIGVGIILFVIVGLAVTFKVLGRR